MKHLRLLAVLLAYTAFMVLMESILPWAPLTNAAVTNVALMVLGITFAAGLHVGERKMRERSK